MNVILFELFPYGAAVVAVAEGLRRYLKSKFTYSSLSSQFLEHEQLFLGSILWHFGIIIVLLGHLIAFLFPAQLLAFNRVPVRLYILEVSGLIFGLAALVGLVILAVRRAVDARVRAVTSAMDIVILAVLLAQVVLGVHTALTLRWGSNWFAVALTPYLRSLFVLQPDASFLMALPWSVKLHVLGAWVLLALLPFSRLMHMLALPLQYLWLRPQLVIWNRAARARRSPPGGAAEHERAMTRRPLP